MLVVTNRVARLVWLSHWIKFPSQNVLVYKILCTPYQSGTNVIVRIARVVVVAIAVVVGIAEMSRTRNN